MEELSTSLSSELLSFINTNYKLAFDTCYIVQPYLGYYFSRKAHYILDSAPVFQYILREDVSVVKKVA